ncbi:uncharacterized protein LOC119724061 [Patiria miniata]|uniref:G-protein coupled receptor n=1 Tax=Patiria miniata TaxID=46514 RepID=A0A913ZIN7_PATMI|nr:uncharacterized protein LOC119724061 [Patiria miniata]
MAAVLLQAQLSMKRKSSQPQSCKSISHCVAGQLNCTTATDQQCHQCDGDYGPNGAAYSSVNNGSECRKQCSWRDDSSACYPGSCTDANCTCSSGFLGPDCMTLGSGQAPVLPEHRATLEGSTTLESPVVNGSTDTVYTNVRDFARIKIYWESSYQPVGLPNSSAGGHPYIHNVSLGVVWARVEAYVNRSTTLISSIAEQNCSTTTDGVHFSQDSPAAILVVCEHTFNVNYSSWTPVTGDVLRYDVHSTNGGYLKLYDRDSNNTIITRYYNGQTVSGYSTFTFDFDDPYHCVDVGSGCRTTMLNVGSDVTSQATMTITLQGWADDLAGIKEYNLEVRQLSGNHGNEMTEIFDIPAVYSGVYSGVTNSSQNVTLPRVGVSTRVYSIVLTTVDNAGNFRLSRRFVFFDDDPDDVTMQNNASVRLLSATKETDYEWLIDLDSSGGMTSVVLDWTNRFINIHHLNQGFLKPIGSYVNATIDDDYDQNFGQRGRAAVPNALGVTEFRVFYDIDHSGGRTTVNVSDDNSDNWSNEATNTQATYNLTLVDSDSIRFWVEARDIAGHFVRDSVLVHADSSPPTIQDFKLIPGLSGISVECTTFDEHSGANTVKWRLFHVDNGTEMEHVSETTPVEHIDPEGCNPATCLCVPIGDCYSTNYKPSFVVDDRAFEYYITLTVTNHAGLATSATFKTEWRVTPDNVDQTAESLAKQTNDTSSISADDVATAADLLDSIANAQDTSPDVTANVIKIVNNLLQVDTGELYKTTNTSRIVRALEKQIANVLAAGKNVSEVTSSVAVIAMNLDPSLVVEGLQFVALSDRGETTSLLDDNFEVYYGTNSTDVPLEKVEASVKIPDVVLNQLPPDHPVQVSFVLYDSSNLFRSQRIEDSQSTENPQTIGCLIISASLLNVSITDLPQERPVVITFNLHQAFRQNGHSHQTETCIFWDFSLRDGIGDWSTEGCRKGQPTNGRIVCLCDHATNFAVLVTSPMNTVDEDAEDLVSQSNDSSSIDAGAFDQIADQLDDIVNSQDTSPEVTANVIKVVNNLLQVDTREFNDSESAANSSSRIVRALERQVWNVLAAGKNISAVTTSVAVVASHFNAGALLNGVVFAGLSGGGGSESLADEDIGVFHGSDGDIPLVKVEVSIKLPEEILKLFPTGSAVPISFVMYENSNLFHSQQVDNASSTEFPTAIASRIISASVPNVSISDLPYDSPVYIVIEFPIPQVMSPMENTEQTETCVFWDFILRDGIGDWSPEGCRTDQLTNGRIVCLCDHATNFAVLVNIHGKKFTSLALDIISKAGCIVSIVALVITIAIYSSLRSLRSKTPSRILISFSLSLLCLYLVFVAGIEQTSSRVGCIVVAVLMHYFTLTSVAWMGVEAASMYLKLVRVFNSDVEHFMIKASVVAWGLPSLVIDVILAVDYTVYDNEYSCFLKPGAAFFFGQLLIIGLVFLFNAVIFVLISRKFLCRDKTLQSTANTSKKKQGTTMKRLQNIAAVSLLLGMTWVFGLLSIFEASSFAFQVIFAVCNSLQGLFIFLLFVVRQEKIRASVMARLRGRNRVDANATTAASVSKVISNPEEDKEPGSNELTDDSILSEKYEKDNGAPNSPETAETTYL